VNDRRALLLRVAPLAATIALAASVAACVAGAPDATRPPMPAPLPEWKTGPPTPGLVWLAGHWHWDDARWVWVPGHWESPPPAALGR
jgi:hypothetical protein